MTLSWQLGPIVVEVMSGLARGIFIVDLFSGNDWELDSSSYSSLDWVLSHWVHFTVHRFRPICVCVYLCFFLFHTA